MFRRLVDPWLAQRARLAGPNVSLWHDAIQSKRAGVPVITVSNHVDEWDDPAVLAALPLTEWNQRIRPFHSLGHCRSQTEESLYYRRFVQSHVLPVRVGDGIRQPALADAAAFLQSAGASDPWLHVFVEGAPDARSGTELRAPIKHGIARVILECQPVRPLILPFIHTPSARGTCVYPGRPIDGGVLMARMPADVPLAVMYFSLTRHLQDELEMLYKLVDY